MNVVALRAITSEWPAQPAADSRIARIEVFEDIADAEAPWRALEHGHCLSTPYQSYDFLALWQRHVGSAAGVKPFIVAGFNTAGQPVFVWPFGCRALGKFRVVEFLGGPHANFNMALWRRCAAADVSADNLAGVVAQLAGRADLLALTNQPLTWGGTTNPFALLVHQRSANFGFGGSLAPDFEALLRARTNAATRKKMRKKERMLASYGPVRFERVTGSNEIRRALDAFFKQKSARMRSHGISDVFAAPGVRRFIEAATSEPVADREPPIELYSLSVNDIIVATIGGIVGGGRFCGMFNSIAQGRYAVESPGEQLILNLVRRCCERGLDTFDLGIGEAHYKHLFCNDAEPLFDSYLPLSSTGRFLAHGFAGAAALKRAVKQRPLLWSFVKMMRRLRTRASAAR